MKRTFVVATLVAAALSTSAVADESTWIFQPGRYTHHPVTGERVAQYAQTPPVAALPDNSANVSGYHRTRVRQRGADGTIDTYYRVESFGNGRGGFDAEWERFYDAERQGYLLNDHGVAYGLGRGYGPSYGYGPGYGYGYAPGSGRGYAPGYGYGGGPAYSYGPGYGYPPYGKAPGYGQPGLPGGAVKPHAPGVPHP